MGFELTAYPIKAQTVLVDERNRFVRNLSEEPAMTLAYALASGAHNV